MKFIALLKNKLKILFICSAFFICNAAVCVDAAQVTFVVEGYLDYVDEGLSQTFSMGDLYHLEYTVNSATVDTNPDDPDIANYENAIISLTVTVGNYYSATSTSHNSISVYNDNLYKKDRYSIFIPAESITGDDAGQCYLYSQGPLLSFGDGNGNAFSDDSLIPYTLDFSNFSGALSLTFYDPLMSDMHWTRGIFATISSFEFYPVPVPSTLLLLLSGLAGLFGVNRIKQ